MIKKIFIFLIILIIPFTVKAENIRKEWEKNIDWNNDTDAANYIFKTKDDEYIVIARTNSTDLEGVTYNGGNDVIILKYDKDWNMVWQKNWGGNGDDYFYNVLQTSDDGFLAVAQSTSTNIDDLENKGGVDAFIIKYDKDWNIEWQKSWGGDRKDYFSYAFETHDNCYMTFGRSQSKNLDGISKYDSYYDAIMVKYDKQGNMIWEKKWGGNRHERLTKIIQTEDKGFIAVGQTNSSDIEGISNGTKYVSVIIEFDKDMNLMTQRKWEPTGNGNQSEFLDIIRLTNGDYILTARNNSTNLENITNKGEQDIIVVKYDKDWNLLWQKNWGGNEDDIPEQLIKTNDNSFVIIGYSSSNDIEGITNNGKQDAVIIKFDKDGNVLWYDNYGGAGDDNFQYAIQNNDGTLISLCVSDLTGIEDIEEHSGKYGIIIKYSQEYELEKNSVENGDMVVEQQNNIGIVSPIPNKGYKVYKVIVKDLQGNEIETVANEDGTYSFELYTDVTVEVLFKEAIENPKTGILDVMTILIIGFLMSITGFFIVKNYSERLEI